MNGAVAVENVVSPVDCTFELKERPEKTVSEDELKFRNLDTVCTNISQIGTDQSVKANRNSNKINNSVTTNLDL